ncbi:hypothetical protein PPUJ20005_46260 [Pseudomonas putida]|nr:hypothetical protein PPUJ20005_46260 [Pseudomonas putida]GLO22937.1 hypothetical protein PPUJ21368_07630 [Pseudomonas putida]
MLARLAGNAAHLKMMGAIAPEKTATKSNMADGQGAGAGVWVGIQQIYRPLTQGLHSFKASAVAVGAALCCEGAGKAKDSLRLQWPLRSTRLLLQGLCLTGNYRRSRNRNAPGRPGRSGDHTE